MIFSLAFFLALVYNSRKKDLLEKPISATLYEAMGKRQSYSASGENGLEVTENGLGTVSFMSPIVAEGNVIGAVMSIKQNGKTPDGSEKKLIDTGAYFMSSQTEI